MNIKQIKLSLLILFGLIVSSYGFLIFAQENSDSPINILSKPSTETTDSTPNLTKDVAKKIATIASNADNDPDVTMSEIEELVDGSLSLQETKPVLPTISLENIKIKKQNYSKYPPTIAKEKEKEDSISYATGLLYVLNSNSPNPVDSLSEMSSFFTSLPTIIAPAITTGNTSSLNQLNASGEKILEQMKDLEVPEKLLETHIKTMQYIQYSTTIKNMLASQNQEDPLKTLSDLAKISGFLESLAGFSAESAQVFQNYIPENDSSMVSQLEKYGISVDINDTSVEDKE